MEIHTGDRVGIHIVSPACASCALAGEELRFYLRKVLKVKAHGTQTASTSTAEPAIRFFLGRTRDLADADVLDREKPDVSDPEGFLVHVADHHVVLGGGEGVGVLYAVYTFVERFLGVRFVRPGPDGEWIPRGQHVELSPGTIVETPAFTHRGCTPLLGRRPDEDLRAFRHFVDWMAKNRLNFFSFCYLDALPRFAELATYMKPRGIKLDVGGHCLARMLYGTWDMHGGPQERDQRTLQVFHAHPEWHCLKDGYRVVCKDHYGHFCLSNTDAVDTFCREVVNFLKRWHTALNFDSMSICLSDSNAVFCECETCRRQDRHELTQRFYRTVSDRIHRVFPELQMRFTVYADYITPDDRHRLPADTGVDMATWLQDYRYGLNQGPPKHARYRRLIERWLALTEGGTHGRDVGLFQYYSYGRCSAGPRLQALFEDARWLRRKGIRRLHDNLLHAYAAQGLPRSLTGYFMARALWNPDIEPQTCVAEIFDPLYGDAAPQMTECLRLSDGLDCAAWIPVTWWRWRQYPVALIRDTLTCCSVTLETLDRIDALLSEVGGAKELRTGLQGLGAWQAWSAATRENVEVTRTQYRVLSLLIQTDRAGGDLEDPDLTERVHREVQASAYLARRFDDTPSPSPSQKDRLAASFGWPRPLVDLFSAIEAKGAARALANATYHAVHNWQGCRDMKRTEGCDRCGLITCADFLEGPGRKRYAVRESPPELRLARQAKGGTWIVRDKADRKS